MKTYKTNYSVAVNWCNNALILCNNITEIDPSVYDNMRFELFDEEDGSQRDIYQLFITDCTTKILLKSYYSRVRLATASKSEIWHGTSLI
jgi:hypothetical protein